MAILRYVAFFPPTGFADRPWDADKACDALVKTGRRVAEVLSREIASAELVGPSSEVRVFVRPAPEGSESVDLDVHLDFMGSFESAVAFVPASVADLTPEARAEVAMQVLLGTLRSLAPHRGWAEASLDTAEASCRAVGLEYVWRSPWKASSDRRREARATFWLADHGFGRSVLEVRARGDEGGAIARSHELASFCTAAGFQRSAKSIRWKGDCVTMAAAIGLLGAVGGLDSFDGETVAGPEWTPPPQTGPGMSQVPTVLVAGSRIVTDSHQVRFVGGGPTNGVPSAYDRGLAACFKRLGDDGLAWWSAADRTLLQIQFHITEDGEPRIRVTRVKDRVRGDIYRPVGTFTKSNGGDLAKQDANALVAAVAKRMGLGPGPAF